MSVEPPDRPALVLSCEHGGNAVPPAFRGLFAGHEALLASHRGWDPGALQVAEALAAAFGVALHFSVVTRLLVETNRTATAPDLFSPVTAGLDAATRQRLMDAYYWPHRRAVEADVARHVNAGRRALHVSVHSCVDELDGVTRDLDLALLFDPARRFEADTAQRWRGRLRGARPELRCPFNQPYRGTDDGLTTALRAQFSDAQYAGIEVELRQGWVADAAAQADAARLLGDTLGLLVVPA